VTRDVLPGLTADVRGHGQQARCFRCGPARHCRVLCAASDAGVLIRPASDKGPTICNRMPRTLPAYEACVSREVSGADAVLP